MGCTNIIQISSSRFKKPTLMLFLVNPFYCKKTQKATANYSRNKQGNKVEVQSWFFLEIPKNFLTNCEKHLNPKRHRSRETWPHFDQALFSCSSEVAMKKIISFSRIFMNFYCCLFFIEAIRLFEKLLNKIRLSYSFNN